MITLLKQCSAMHLCFDTFLFNNLSNCYLCVFEAECFKDRTDVQCLHRWQKVLNPELVKGPWSKEVFIYIPFVLCYSDISICRSGSFSRLVFILPNHKPITAIRASLSMLQFSPCFPHCFDVALDYINFLLRYLLIQIC